MSILNVISITVFLILLTIGIVLFRRFRKNAQEVDGVCGVNERGEIGSSREGDIVGDA